ncbi:protein phosphatase 2C domain-containing protein [Microbacterium sp. cx-55]|uniref:PP2C family protein-serine/threonine phosphatase n=1 Tax=Microbacterium sp. cx-55 TaxID=2875948 RepID=UPI001CBBFDB0|nr:protein phosphatase 2C domain-containing protein [Microbacterium sp. cx-55]MBZ4485764.1 protein phosphatase 2C domain-containing protein [Microbacterium sp. cx-55]UGB34352.1 protein phosphatase 2C domain-containing protein [Microbacterium sp. cx-55]
MTEGIVLVTGARTDVGRVREINEDAVLAQHPVFLVADGMGGHEAGELASAEVVAAFQPLVGRQDVEPADVVDAVAAAHAAVARLSRTHARGAGSTVSGIVAVVQNGVHSWLVVNIGDSRVYRLVGSTLEQLTVDHSVVQELVDEGRITRAEMSTYPGRNVITRAVGDQSSAADYWLAPIVTGERLLVCSDGLSNDLSDEALRAGLSLGGSAQQTAHGLVDQALARGGRDNISAVVVDVRSGGLAQRADEVTGGFATSAEATVHTIDIDTHTSERQRARRD